MESIEEVALGENDGDWLVPGRIHIGGLAGTKMAALIPEHTLLSFCFDLGLTISPVTYIERKESGFCADHRIMPKFGSMTLDGFDGLSQKANFSGSTHLAGVQYFDGKAREENRGAMTQSISSLMTSNLFEADGLHVAFNGTLGKFAKANLGLWPNELPVGHAFEIAAFIPKPTMLVAGLNAGWIPWTKLQERKQRS